MGLKVAIEILEYHNRWRRGQEEDMRYSPTKIGIAIDTILKHLKQSNSTPLE